MFHVEHFQWTVSRGTFLVKLGLLLRGQGIPSEKKESGMPQMMDPAIMILTDYCCLKGNAIQNVPRGTYLVEIDESYATIARSILG